MLTCPVCSGALTRAGRTWRCETGHAFDEARQGYVDLLPVGHGRSGITGDTAEMARARRRFLAGGHFEPLTRRIVDRVREHPAGRIGVVAEVGCGTGRYIGAVTAGLPEVTGYGFDVSAAALRLAARDHPRVTFVVNDITHRLCLPDASVDVLLDVFAPRNATEFRRVLRPDGLLLVVVPGERHLAELRARLPLLDIGAAKRARTIASLAPAFEPAREEALEWRAVMSGADVADLVGMTPSAFHLDDDDLAAAALADADAPGVGTSVTLAFQLLGFRPASRPPS